MQLVLKGRMGLGTALRAAILAGVFLMGGRAALAEMPASGAFKVASSTQATTSTETLAPMGWVQFCRDYANDPRKPCARSTMPPVDIRMDSYAWKELNRINTAVNSEIAPLTDREHWNVVDRWDFPDDGKGDCEDYVIEKRHRLMKAGFPRQALLVTVVRDLEGEGHAVLTVKTDKGDYILDNMNEAIRPWTATGYKFVKRQSQVDPNVWVSLGSVDTAALYTSRN